MEKNIIVEENYQCSGSKLSMPVESSIKIDSISIDLINANGKSDADNCNHFSIRGYVSEIRKKDWKMCWPFTSDCISNKYDEQPYGLPSLHVPKYRYWRCQKCLWEIGAKGLGNAYSPNRTSCTSGFNPNSICCHTSVAGDTKMLVSDFQQAPKLDIFDEKKVGGDALADLNNSTGDCPSPYFGKNEKNSEVTHGLTRGKNVESGDIMSLEMHRLATGISTPRKKTYQTDSIEDLKSKSNVSIDLGKPDHVHHEVADGELGRNLNCMGKNVPAKIHDIEKLIPMVDQQKELIACEMSGEVGNIEEACNAGKGSGHPSLELDECDNGSSESAKIMVVSNVQDQDNSSGLHRKKTRKVRLLTELLCKNSDGTIDNVKNDDSPPNAVHDASAEGDKLPVPQGQATIQGNLKRGSGQHRKRKSDQDEDWRPLQTSSPIKVCKESSISKKKVVSTDAIARAFARMQLQTGRKNLCVKRRTDRSLRAGKKITKKTLNFHESSSLAPAQENVPNEIGNKTGDASNSSAADRLAITGGGAGFLPVSPQRMDKKLSFRKKSKMPQVGDRQASLIPKNHGILGQDPMSRKDVEFLHTRPVKVPFQRARDTSSENALNLSLNGYLTTQRYDMHSNPQLESVRTCMLSWKEGAAGDAQFNTRSAETKYLGNLSFAAKSAPDMAFGKVYNDFSGKRIPMNERQIFTSEFEIGGCSRMQQKNFCSTSSKTKAIGIQECSAVTRKDGANKGAEQVISDDIPMEIVELMAKHQYERCLPDAENDRSQLEGNNNKKSGQPMNFNKVYGNGEMSLFRQETTLKQNSHAGNGRNGITMTGENMGPIKQKSVDYFSQSKLNQLNMSQLKHPPATRCGVLFQHQEKLSNGIKHCASNSSGQNSAQCCELIGDLLGKRSSGNCLQSSGTCNTCQGIPQQSKETNHIWSSMMPNHMPFVYNIAQKCSALPANMDVLSNSPSSMNKENANDQCDLKFLNQNAASFGKQNRSFGSDVLRTCADPFACKYSGIGQKPMGSFDLYSNETIPAMHLLSLMDAGLQSSAPRNLNVTQKFLKRQSATHDQDPKEFCRLESGAYKVTNPMKSTPCDSHGKNQVPGDSRGRISTFPVLVGPSASSFSHDHFFKKATDFSCQVSQDKGKGKGSDSCTQKSSHRPQKSSSAGGNFGTNCGSIPVHSMQTMFLGASGSMGLPLQFRGLDNSTGLKFEVPSGTRPVHPHKISFSDGICSVNRNPADFSIPEPGNSFMIAGEDLKVGKMVPFVNGYGSGRLVGQKRQKRPPTMKEHHRHLIS